MEGRKKFTEKGLQILETFFVVESECPDAPFSTPLYFRTAAKPPFTLFCT